MTLDTLELWMTCIVHIKDGLKVGDLESEQTLIFKVEVEQFLSV